MDEIRFGFTDDTYRVVAYLASRARVPMVRVVGDALNLYWWLAREQMAGSRLLVQRGAEVNELTVPSLERLMSRSEAACEPMPSAIIPTAPHLSH